MTQRERLLKTAADFELVAERFRRKQFSTITIRPAKLLWLGWEEVRWQ